MRNEELLEIYKDSLCEMNCYTEPAAFEYGF